MKRILLFLALVVALVAVASCEKTSVIRVEASASLIYPDATVIQVSSQSFHFASRTMSDSDLEYMFTSLIRNANQNFSSGTLDIMIFDEVTGDRIGVDSFGVVYNAHDGHYDFARLGSY